MRGVGYPSTMTPTHVIGVDLGGTKILAGLVDHAGEVERRYEIPTPVESEDALLAGLDEAVGELLGGRPYRGSMGGGVELGHITIVHDGRPCQGNCTGHGHLEAYVTGLAATTAAREAFGPSADARSLLKLADDGDEAAIGILAEIGGHIRSAIGTHGDS